MRIHNVGLQYIQSILRHTKAHSVSIHHSLTGLVGWVRHGVKGFNWRPFSTKTVIRPTTTKHYNSHRVYHAKYKTPQSLLDHLFPKLIFTSSISTYLQFLYCALSWHRTNILEKRKYFLKWLLVYERHLQAKETNLLKFWTVHLSNILGSVRTSMILRDIHRE